MNPVFNTVEDIQPGLHQFPFTYLIPANLPGSVYIRQGSATASIIYNMEARIIV